MRIVWASYMHVVHENDKLTNIYYHNWIQTDMSISSRMKMAWELIDIHISHVPTHRFMLYLISYLKKPANASPSSLLVFLFLSFSIITWTVSLFPNGIPRIQFVLDFYLFCWQLNKNNTIISKYQQINGGPGEWVLLRNFVGVTKMDDLFLEVVCPNRANILRLQNFQICMIIRDWDIEKVATHRRITN